MGLLSLPLQKDEKYQDIIQNFKNDKKNIALTGLFSSAKSHLIAINNFKSVVICEDEIKAKEVFKDLQFFLKDKVFFYPSKDIIFYSADIKSNEIIKDRFKVISNVLKKDDYVIVLSIESLFDRLVPKQIFEKFVLSFEVGKNIEIEELAKTLIFMGYERTEMIEGQGQFSVRGGIIDIFSPVNKNAFRIELWGDEIDSIRLLDSDLKRSINQIEKITIYPMRELVYTEKELKNAAINIKKELEENLKVYEQKGKIEAANNLKAKTNEILEMLENKKSFSGVEKYIKYFYPETVSLLDYLSKDTVIYFNDLARVKEQAKFKQKEFFDSLESKISRGEVFPSAKEVLFSYEQIVHIFGSFSNIFLNNFDDKSSFEDFKIDEQLNLYVKNTKILKNNFDDLLDNLYHYKKIDYKIFFLAGNTTRCERLQKEFDERGLTSIFLREESIKKEYDFKNGIVYILRGSISSGFEYPAQKFVLITDNEIFAKEKKKPKKSKHKGKKIQDFAELNVGDYIVHENHGIGIFNGVEKISADGISKDYLKITYDDGGNLYVPINQMDIVQKYIAGGANIAPKLSKLGTKKWENSKTKAKSQIKILAKDLLNLYAKRQISKGFSYSKDNVWQKEFEDSFPYQETDDQISAIEDVKADMESSRVMDRLICGDVGFGKTEVAIRAIFKAVQDGKQVAFLVPTTILAKQHYDNFVKRMENYPINIDLLSRFRLPAMQKETIKNLESGKADVLIGTHRILSKDIKFKDLGLIVIDEEQRFGVKHKEKLKAIKENIDVLTLSATPIPRTLHMSMTGIRDMSVLEEAPSQRIPVQTYVLENDDEAIKTAVNREINRGGQVYYLYNRVESIEMETKKVKELVPYANVSFVHGQMNKRELEKIMSDFMKKEIDVLVCTTIIETGLDIANVNTIIIQNADTMGLSQLYQLRGRVGRANKQAFAYLMYNREKVLKEVSEKRLQVIKDFTEFGSGFKIAMRDLEIRGAGNLIGSEQHGHMEAIGYELYCKLLEQAVAELKGEEVFEDFETLIDLPVNAFIPNNYIKNQIQKLEMYKKIALIKNLDDFYDVQDELEDRFGTMPAFVKNLLDIALMKSYAHNVGATSIIQRGNKITINFNKDNTVDTEILMKIISENPKKLGFSGVLTYKVDTEINPVLDLKELFSKIGK